ncbi:MAG: DUF3467 domain-containing protein [Bryobacterales bacterium]|nr:DUF3467 domain-containing protein [Bryobacterales bacterium]
MQPQKLQFTKRGDYREDYANSIQLRANLWDFFLSFGLIDQKSPDEVSIESFQGVYLSPQQAKALLNLLHQNIAQYEQAFGEIRLEPQGDNNYGLTTPVN